MKDPNDLKQAGWGVIFPAGISADVVAALKPLLERRQQQAGPLYKEFAGYPAGQSARDWLNRKGVAFSLVDPALGVPLYLLLVGGPKQIPFEFQYLLDSYWNVGRLDFDTPADMPCTRRRVVEYEKAATVPTTRIERVVGDQKRRRSRDRPAAQSGRRAAGPRRQAVIPRLARPKDSRSRSFSPRTRRARTSRRFCAARRPADVRRCCLPDRTASRSTPPTPRRNVKDKERCCRKRGRKARRSRRISICAPPISRPTRTCMA